MKHAPAIKNVMTPFPYSIDIEASVERAVQLMREHKVRHLPVTENGAVKGMVSDRDIKLMLGPDFAYPKADELRVRHAMVRDSYIVDLSTPLPIVLSHMAEHRLGSVVITREGKLVGVFTSNDACRVLADLLESQYQVPGDDAA